MRLAAKIIVILGILASIGLGIYWEVDYSESTKYIADTKSSIGIDLSSDFKDELAARQKGGFALIAGGIVSLVSVIMMSKLKKISSILILLSAIVPAIIYPSALVATFLLIIGAILAFFIKPKDKASQAQAV